LLALMLGALMLHVPGADSVGSPALTNVFVGVLVAGTAVYLAAVRLILRNRLSRAAIWIVLGVAVAMRAALLPAPPFLSSDIYRYVWDGQVQAAGINPYRYVPADPALAGLRDPAVFPRINRATYARTIYPPAAQAIFGLVGRVTRTVLGMKLAMAAFEVLAVLCMLRVLSIAGLPPERVLIYAWNPLVLWSFACDGHVDAAAVGLLALALLCRARNRGGAAGAFLAGAALVKFLPVVVAPAFVRGGGLWRPAFAGAAVVAALYALYLAAGAHVIGFLPTYGAEEGLDDGSGLWLLAGLSHLFALPSGAVVIYMVCVAAGFALLSFWIARGRTSDAGRLCRDTAILAAAATAAISPHYAWYFAWLALPCVVAPVPAVIWLSVAPVVLYVDPFHERFFWPSLVYLPAVGLSLAALWRRRRTPGAALVDCDPLAAVAAPEPHAAIAASAPHAAIAASEGSS
jgi:alpha-1,6-mannosyltransferase